MDRSQCGLASANVLDRALDISLTASTKLQMNESDKPKCIDFPRLIIRSTVQRVSSITVLSNSRGAVIRHEVEVRRHSR